MKKLITILAVGIILIGLSSSCLKNEDLNKPTREEELLNLENYIAYLLNNGNDVDTTALGIYYVTLDEGTGDFPKTGDTLTVRYAAYLSDGYLFDSSVWQNSTDSTFTFILGNPPLIKGWDDGMKVINKNAKVQMIIPSDFAYGSTGSGVIPPFETCIFVVSMKDIKPLK